MCKETKCVKCGRIFERIDEEAQFEFQCSDCQTQMRITRANKMHKTGVFIGVEGYKREAFQLKTFGKVLDE